MHVVVVEKDYSTDTRQAMAQKGHALSDGSYPIATRADLANAIKAVGRANDSDRAKVKAHIIKRAKALKATDMLPADWNVSDTGSESIITAQESFSLGTEAEFIAEEAGKPPTRARIVIVRPGESANRRLYTREAIAEAVNKGFWDGSKMFLDHGDAKMPTQRSIKDLVAGIESTSIGADGEAVGDVRFYRPDFAQFAQEAKDAMGVSIVHQFQGQRFKGTDGHYHERVDHFLTNFSVDWVAFPAAGGRIQEFLPATESEDGEAVEWDELTAEMLREHAPAVIEQIVTEEREKMATEGTGDQPVSGASEERVAQIVAEAIEAHDAKLRDEQTKRDAVRNQIVETVGKAGLPEKARAKIIADFAGAESFDEAAVTAAVEDMQDLLKSVGGPRVSGLGSSTTAESEPAAQRGGALEGFEAEMGVHVATEEKK